METKNTCSESLENKYKDVCNKIYINCLGNAAKNDLDLFIPILRDLSSKCDHVTEFGVRTVCSTWGLLAGLPKVLHSYDFVKCNTKEVEEIAKENGVEFKFFCASTVDPKVHIEATDFLFIDTEHTGAQLSAELYLHGAEVRKYIAFHDTNTCPDLLLVIDIFIRQNPQWKYKLKISEGCGFTVIENGTV